MNAVKVVMTGHGRGEVWLNGQKVEHVRGVEFSAEVDRINEVRLCLGVGTVEIEGVGELVEVTTHGDEGRRFIRADVPEDTQ